MGEFVDLSDLDFSETFEPTVKPAGEQVELRIVSFNTGEDKNGNKYIMPFFEPTDDPYGKEFGHYIPRPHDGMSPKEKNRALLAIEGLMKSFDITISSQMDIKNDIVGKTGWAIVGVGKDQDDLPTNTIRKYVYNE